MYMGKVTMMHTGNKSKMSAHHFLQYFFCQYNPLIHRLL